MANTAATVSSLVGGNPAQINENKNVATCPWLKNKRSFSNLVLYNKDLTMGSNKILISHSIQQRTECNNQELEKNTIFVGWIFCIRQASTSFSSLHRWARHPWILRDTGCHQYIVQDPFGCRHHVLSDNRLLRTTSPVANRCNSRSKPEKPDTK